MLKEIRAKVEANERHFHVRLRDETEGKYVKHITSGEDWFPYTTLEEVTEINNTVLNETPRL